MLNMVKNASVQATDIYKDPYGYTYSEMVGVLGEVEADKFYRELYSGSQTIFYKGIMPSEKGFRFSSGL
ncbi:hypothetical protein A4S06_06260 [Erysipelotrichaceae bacterium MTC7]|nr:hypothetical protein A4S06_06260 [Erysipelotrichaceae bacterium MTC7]